MRRDGAVLHICPGVDGSAQCFLQREAEILELPYVMEAAQRRLLGLFYSGRDRRLTGLFKNNMAEPGWAEFFHGVWIAAKVILSVKAIILLLIAVAVFVTDLSGGVPALESISGILSFLPFVLWLLAIMTAAIIPFSAAMMGVVAAVQWTGRTIEIEGRDYTINFTLGAVLLLFMAGLSAWSGEWHKIPVYTGYVFCFFGAFVWPLVVMGRLRRQQDRLLDQIRAQFVVATTLLMSGEVAQAGDRLRAIRDLEAHWRLGAHPIIRYAHIAYATLTNFGIAFAGQVFHYHIQSAQKPASIGDTVLFILETPSVLWITAGVALFFSLFALPDAIRIHGRAWSEFYGDNLDAALKAGRGIGLAEHHDVPPLPEDVSARELLGLTPGFTKAQLRAAWLRLARELHPDRWTSAGDAVRKMKEAALKRVNAARDELAPLAL